MIGHAKDLRRIARAKDRYETELRSKEVYRHWIDQQRNDVHGGGNEMISFDVKGIGEGPE